MEAAIHSIHRWYVNTKDTVAPRALLEFDFANAFIIASIELTSLLYFVNGPRQSHPLLKQYMVHSLLFSLVLQSLLSQKEYNKEIPWARYCSL
jgi:hypothetical protein